MPAAGTTLSDPRTGPGADPAAHWVPSPLLLTPQETPRFLRAPWDVAKADAFGPWRVTAAVDPALALEQDPALALAPQDALAALPAPEAIPELEAPPAAPPGPSPQQVQEIEASAHARGLEEGRAQAMAEIEAERAREAELLRHLVIELRALKEDGGRFFEPLRRLALAIAEQLVRGELQVSGEAIAQIVRQSLSALDASSPDVVVELHPDDARALSAMKPGFLDGLKLQPERSLHRGSVRVRLDDTVVEDLIEHRLEAIAQRLLARPPASMAASPLLRESRVKGAGGVTDVTDISEVSGVTDVAGGPGVTDLRDLSAVTGLPPDGLDLDP